MVLLTFVKRLLPTWAGGKLGSNGTRCFAAEINSQAVCCDGHLLFSLLFFIAIMIEAQQTPLNVVALPKPKQQQQQEPLTLEKLIERIHQILGPDGGLDSEHVDAAEIFRLMESYSSNANDWSKYAFFDHSRAYTRNLVDDGNGKVSFRRN